MHWRLAPSHAAAPDVPPRGSAGLWERESTQACGARHKAEPLFSALAGYDTWFTALRRDQSSSRANLKEVEPFQLPNKVIYRI